MTTRLLIAVLLAAACSTDTQVFGDPSTGSDGGVPTGISPPLSPIDETCRSALVGPFEASLPAPGDIVVEEDEFRVRLTWNGPLGRQNDSIPSSVEGYRVCFGASETALQHGVLVDDRTTDLLGIEQGVAQVAVIQSVDALGRISAPSETIRFESRAARVETLRSEMTGFFDDFNADGIAPLDEQKWNVAYSYCNDEPVSHVYRQQQRLVSVTGNDSRLPGALGGDCDRNQNTIRARSLFDFAGREGRIAFDVRGTAGGRSAWRLDVVPAEDVAASAGARVDMMGAISLFADPSYPGGGFRIVGFDRLLSLYAFDAEGEALGEVSADLRGAGYPTLPLSTIMRHIEVRVGNNRVQVLVDGAVVLERSGVLGFSRGQVLFSHVGFDPRKQGFAWSQMELDNFGFDGPSLPDNTRNYRGARGFADRIETGGEETWTLTIPDSIAEASRVRFFYTIQTLRYRWDPSDRLMINGMAFPILEPSSPGWSWRDGDLAQQARPFSTSMDVPLGVFRTGPNTIAIAAQNTALINQHVEVRSSTGFAAPFSQPSSYLAERVAPVLPGLAPFIALSGVDGSCVSLDPVYLDADGVFEVRLPMPISGPTTLSLGTNTEAMLAMTGVNYGISRVELYVNGALHNAVDTAARVPAPAFRGGPAPNAPETCGLEIILDATALTNGTHTFSFRAYDAEGTRARERYGFEAAPVMGLEAGVTVPVIFEVAN